VTEFRYSGALSSTTGKAARNTDTAHGPNMITRLQRAEIGYIDDPMSFPWELLHSGGAETPLVVDVSACSQEQMLALRPALGWLSSADTLHNATTPDDAATQRLARILGVRSQAPEPTEWESLRRTKRLDQCEDAILERARREWQTRVVDITDVGASDWRKLTWSTPGDHRRAAIAIRLPGRTIRAERSGFRAAVEALLAMTEGAGLLGVWGVRAAPGDPLDRGVVVLAANPRA
jgi:hypothetical protein